MRAAWEIADIVERACAADRVRIRGLRRGQNRRQAIDREFDPLAATCLALLIKDRMFASQQAAVSTAEQVGIPASCRDEPKDRHQPTTPGEQGEEG